jgi:hypothetical protein
MPTTIFVHLVGQDPFLAETEELPQPNDQSITVINARQRDGKPLHYIADETTSVIFPLHRINFIEVMPSEESREEIDLFFRT